MTARGLALSVLVPLALIHCSPAHEVGDFQVGVSQDVLVDRFGQPDQVDTLRKTTDHVFGPIETFWVEVALDAQVEIWFYMLPEGTVELYFVEGGRIVEGKGFAPEGAVF